MLKKSHPAFFNSLRRVLLLVLVLAQTGCTGLFFQPSGVMERTPRALGLSYQDVYFTTVDGVRLHGWYLPARGRPVGSLLFLHGNAENISTHIFSVGWLPRRSFNVFLFDYRGYGLSQGRPSMAGVQRDYTAAQDWLLARPFERHHGIVVFGQSLGGSIAIYGVAHSQRKKSLRALVSESAPSDYRGIAREKLGGFFLTWPFQWPLSLTISDAYSPLRAIRLIKHIPILIIQGTADRIVPYHHALRLYEAAVAPKELWTVEGGRHIQAFAFERYRRKFVNYLRGLYGYGPVHPPPSGDVEMEQP